MKVGSDKPELPDASGADGSAAVLLDLERNEGFV